MFACNFAPSGWSTCNGQLLSTKVNPTLYQVLGVLYGGNGTTNYALPDLTAAAAICYGNAPGMTALQLGQEGGADEVLITMATMPSHSHKPAAAANGKVKTAAGSIWAALGAVRPEPNFYATSLTGKPINMATGLLSLSGGGTLHNNLMPFQGLNFCIALQGVSPYGVEGELEEGGQGEMEEGG